MKKIVMLFIFLAVLPRESKAECQTYEEGQLAYTNVAGLSLKYLEPKNFYVVVSVAGEQYLPEILKRKSVIKTVTKYLQERMLPCTGLKKIEVIADPYDKRLVEDDVLVAYVRIDYHRSIDQPPEAATVFRQPTAKVRSGYVRSYVYLRSQFYDEKISFIPLDGEENQLNELVQKRIIRTLHPTIRYNANVEPKHNPDLKVLRK